jgi:hypothetical protein
MFCFFEVTGITVSLMQRHLFGFTATTTSREANVSFRNSSHKAKNIYARANNNNPPGVAHNRNRY